MKTLTLTVSSSLRDPRCSPCRVFEIPTRRGLSPSFRAYPRLTAINRGKTRLIAPKPHEKFYGRFPRLIRGCATEAATAPPCRSTISHQPSADQNLTPTNGKSRLLTPFKKVCSKPLQPRVSSHLKVNIGKYSQLKPLKYFAHDLTHDPNLILRVPLRPSCSTLNLNLNASRTYSELFGPVQSCSDLIFYSDRPAVPPW